MTEKSPAFQFYPKDYQTDGKVRMMSWEARGVYVDLLCTYWLEGSLPADPKRLANMVGMTPRRFEKLWPQIAPCFEVDGKTLKQKRLILEREKQKAFRESQSEKGKKGGKPKGNNETPKPEVIQDLSRDEAEDEPKQSLPFASSSPAPAIQPPSSPSVDSQTDADAARAELRKAVQAFREFVNTGQSDQVILELPKFHSTSGGIVQIDTCTNARLMLAVAAKVRAATQPKAKKSRKGDPWGHDPNPPEYEEATQWVDAQGIPLLNNRAEIDEWSARAPEALRGHVGMILFARNPHARAVRGPEVSA